MDSKQIDEKLRSSFARLKQEMEQKDTEIITLKQAVEDLYMKVKHLEDGRGVIEIKRTDIGMQNELLELRKEISELKERIRLMRREAPA